MAFPKLSTLIGGTAISFAALGAAAKEVVAQNPQLREIAPAGPACDPKDVKPCLTGDTVSYVRGPVVVPFEVYQLESLDDSTPEHIGTVRVPTSGPFSQIMWTPDKKRRAMGNARVLQGQIPQGSLARGYLAFAIPNSEQDVDVHPYMKDLIAKDGGTLFSERLSRVIDGKSTLLEVYDRKQLFDEAGNDPNQGPDVRAIPFLFSRVKPRNQCASDCKTVVRGDYTLARIFVEHGAAGAGYPVFTPGPIQWMPAVHDTMEVPAKGQLRLDGALGGFVGLDWFDGHKNTGPGADYSRKNALTDDRPGRIWGLGGRVNLHQDEVDGSSRVLAYVTGDFINAIGDGIPLTLRDKNNKILAFERSRYNLRALSATGYPAGGSIGSNIGMHAGYYGLDLDNQELVMPIYDPSVPPGALDSTWHRLPTTSTRLVHAGLVLGPAYLHAGVGYGSSVSTNESGLSSASGLVLTAEADFRKLPGSVPARAYLLHYALNGTERMPSPETNETMLPSVNGNWLKVEVQPFEKLGGPLKHIYLRWDHITDHRKETTDLPRRIDMLSAGLHF